jgi:lantibiotic transport system permease protein
LSEYFNALMRALSAEHLKLRNTLAGWMTLIAPATVVGLITLQFIAQKGPMKALPEGEGWMTVVMSQLGLWSFLMMPLYVTLQAALLAGLEHSNRQFKHLKALPVPASVHYVAKWFVLLEVVVASCAVMVLIIPCSAMVLQAIKPNYGLDQSIPWVLILSKAAIMPLAALAMLSLQLWVSMHWRSFTVAVSMGMCATVLGYIIGQSKDYGPWYPWSMAVQTMAKTQDHIPLMLFVSATLALMVLLLGAWQFSRSDEN